MAEAQESSSPMQIDNILTTSKNMSFRYDSRRQLAIENFIVVWLDIEVDRNHKDFASAVAHFQNLVHVILLFKDLEQCIDFISDTNQERVFLIVCDSVPEETLLMINSFQQIDSIYLFDPNKTRSKKWINEQKKMRGVFYNMGSIYDVMRRDVRQCEDDLIPFVVLSSKFHEQNNLNETDRIFIFTHILKELLMNMKHKPNALLEFVNFCYYKYEDNKYQLQIIQEFEHNYKPTSCIRWYTRECFMPSMLNKAMRVQDLDLITKMSFIIQDIHQEIKMNHSKLPPKQQLIVYRGQGISEQAFHIILQNQHGFLSFNNFLTTTTNRDLSIMYARCARDYHEHIGILFIMEVDTSQSLFTPLNKISYYIESENEILFSIHSTFRIHSVDQIEDGLWQIQLKLTKNENEQLTYLKKLLKRETDQMKDTEQLNAAINKLKEFQHPKLMNASTVNSDQSIEKDIPLTTQNDQNSLIDQNIHSDQ